MQFFYGMSRTILAPLQGVQLTRNEELESDKIARDLEALPIDTINTVMSALAAQILYLDQMEPWTTGDKEEKRKSEQECAAITYRACRIAKMSKLIRRKVGAES